MFPVKQLTSSPPQEGFACWTPDGKSILYQFTDMQSDNADNGLWLMNSDGSDKRQIFSGLAEHAQISPDGTQIVFDADTGNSIRIVPIEGGKANLFLPDTIIIENGGLPCWSPDGRNIAFLERSGLSVCIYNLNTGNLSSIFRKEGYLPMIGCWLPDGSGILVALMNFENRKSTLWKISSDGSKNTQITGHHENLYRHLAVSPDCSLLVYAALVDRSLGLYIMPFKGGAPLPLTIVPKHHNEGPAWSPDGTKLAFTSTRANNFDIWVMDIDLEKLKEMLMLN